MKRNFFLFLILFSCLLQGCSFGKKDTLAPDPAASSESQSPAKAPPKYLTAMKPHDGGSNLYELKNSAFAEKPYENILSFGDNLLLVGEAIYGELDGNEGDYELPFEFSFDLYSPWENTLLASLDHDSISCDLYQVFGDRLFLCDSVNQKLAVYDSALTLTKTYDISSFCGECSLTLSPTKDPDVFYTYNYTTSGLVRLTFLEDRITAKELSSDPYSVSGIEDSDGQGRLVRLGIDSLTMGYVTQVLDDASLKPLLALPGCGYFSGDVSENAFVAKTNSAKDYWAYQAFDREPAYFYLPDAYSVTLLPDSSLVTRQETFDSDSGSDPVTYCLYDSGGNYLDGFTYECYDDRTEGYKILSFDYAYLPEAQSMFFISQNPDSAPSLLIWDLRETGSGEESLAFYSSEEELAVSRFAAENAEGGVDGIGTIVTALPDVSSYDWGELEKINDRATELEKSYDIEIYFGPEIPEMIDVFHTAQETDPNTLDTALTVLEDILGCYPENFFSQLCFGDNRGIRIYLTGSITSDGSDTVSEAGGFVNEMHSHLVMVLNTSYSWDWNYTVNHELSHMVDRRLAFGAIYDQDALFSEETWNSYNPKDYSYMESYVGYESNPDYERYPTYFADSYGTTFPTEDRAELFGWALNDYLNNVWDDALFAPGSPTAEKFLYYCKCIRDNFDTEGWAGEMPWEVVLQQNR